MMSFGDHLEELRRMLFRVIVVSVILAVVVFCAKSLVWQWLLAPSSSSFCTYRAITTLMHALGQTDFQLQDFSLTFVATELSSQFVAHVSSSFWLGLLLSSPFVTVQVFRFIAPALRDSEYHYGRRLTLVAYVLFLLGLLLSYFVLFPVSCRFLATYSVSDQVHTMVTIDSYMQTFVTLTLMTGLAFQLPVVTYLLARMHIVRAGMLSRYRRHALLLVLVLSAIITPPDAMSLLMVALPLYLLYEMSIIVVRRVR